MSARRRDGGLVVLASGVSWDDAAMSEKHMAQALSTRTHVLFVDPPLSVLTPLRKPHLRDAVRHPGLREVAPGLSRVTPLAPPGVTRPGLRRLALAVTRTTIRRAVRRLGLTPSALVVASLDDVFGALPTAPHVLWATDDWVAGAELMGLDRTVVEQDERHQLARCDVVAAVSPVLARRLQAHGVPTHVLPNGVDAPLLATCDQVPAAQDVRLPPPVATFIGHVSARIDLQALLAVARTGASLLLVGPQPVVSSLEGLDELLAHENVQWTGPRAAHELPGYLRLTTVGLTPYVDTAFNRASHPLKTLEYLAAGRPAVVTDLPAARTIPPDLVALCTTPTEFADATLAALHRPADPAAADRRRAYAAEHSWQVRADQLLTVIDATAPSPGGGR
ncbi:glycosyltransferase [Cellulomonas citrea]|uniref:glycosyltransferase n=1 Tax=Cellulomonas citrea TaxID=1909423 RepID=UPI00135C4DFA|nr:glycosyltransferase [Cellulomonas citrea]